MTAEVKTVTPVEAWEMMKGNQRVVMIDVRSSIVLVSGEYLIVSTRANFPTMPVTRLLPRRQRA